MYLMFSERILFQIFSRASVILCVNILHEIICQIYNNPLLICVIPPACIILLCSSGEGMQQVHFVKIIFLTNTMNDYYNNDKTVFFFFIY